jgi:HSP20 family protein
VSPSLSSVLASNWPTQSPTTKHIPLDVIEKPHLYELKGDLPGIREEEVKLSVDGDVLSISVENVGKAKEETKEEGGIKVHRIERSAAFARRAIRLPESANTENISADLNHGVLTVHIPKREKAPRQRTIPIGKKAGTKAVADSGPQKTIADHTDGSKNIAVETAHA